MDEDEQAVAAKVEPDAVKGDYIDFEASIAISLKRIADALSGTDKQTGIAMMLGHIEQTLGGLRG